MRTLLLILLCCSLLAPATSAQEQEEVVRINTELVQTDVMVFDKQGRFVDGLQRDQFELRVNGKPQAISFFERVQAGTFDEEAQLAAARGGGRRTSALKEGAVKPLDRGRTIIFFIDDLHLAADSVVRTRKLLLQFIEEQLGQNDQAIIASASGQIGFLQQLTDYKPVLRAAVVRLNHRPYITRDSERPTMSESQAIAIEQEDFTTVEYFVEATLRENPSFNRRDRAGAEDYVRQRASRLVQQATAITTNTLASLENFMRSFRELPGRKLVYFISDGFLLEMRRSDILERLRRITDAATRSGSVIYTLDARGLSTGTPDAASNASVDPSGRASRSEFGELSASQEPLRTLASDTGGRALLNTNALGNAVTKALKETSVYYLLAWRPERGELRSSKFQRVEVSVKNRPDLTVLVQRGFFNTLPEPPAKRGNAKSKDEGKDKTPHVKSPDDLLFAALRALHPATALPTSLSVGYTSTQTAGLILMASMHIDSAALDLKVTGDAHQNNKADIIGAVLDDNGKIVSGFQKNLTVTPEFIAAEQRIPLVYSHQFRITHGLYQVRVAARDRQSGRTGSAMQWVEVPNVTQGGFWLSSVFLGERMSKQVEAGKDPAEPAQVLISADRRFARNSWLRFLLYIYNAARDEAAPDVALQVQLFRDNQPVLTTPLRKVPTDGMTDLNRIPYAAEIALTDLPAGLYRMQVTAIDRKAKTSASQHVNFEIE